MNAVEGTLLLLVAALALVGFGYWLGRTWPGKPLGRQAKGPLLPQVQRVRHLRPLQQWRQPQPQQSQPEHGPATAAQRPARAAARPDIGARLQQEMDHVRALRRAREHAEPWHPPAVDAVEAPMHAVWFADTAVEPHKVGSAP
jgi:hypothetical protein